MSDSIKKIIAFAVGLFIALLILELCLRIFNPLPATIKGDKIVLRANYKIEFENNINANLPKTISVNGNSLGFRGPEPTLNQNFKILTVGGSTTRCMYSPDSLTWSFLLGKQLIAQSPNIWLNNAGLTGHSTFGHLVLLQDYLVEIRPKMILFLIGLNDVERDFEDTFILQDSSSMNSTFGKIKRVLYKSETVALGLNLFRFVQAKKLNLNSGFDFKLNSIPAKYIPKPVQQERLEHQKEFLTPYKKRVQSLIDVCQKNGITPVFITQPALFGDVIDPTTGLDVSKLQYNDINCSLMWEILEKYNKATIDIAKENEVHYIDLDKKLPKDSKYYWDFVHYSPAGNKRISEILTPDVVQIYNSLEH